MALRIACLLLSVLVYVPFCAAQAFNVEQPVTPEPFGTGIDIIADLSNEPVCDAELADKIDNLFRSLDGVVHVTGTDFPFSPRRIRQRNYGIQNADAPQGILNFTTGNVGVLLENNAGQTLNFGGNSVRLHALTDTDGCRCYIVRTSGTGDAADLEFVIGADGTGTLQTVPAAIELLMVEACDEALCEESAECADDEPIDVVLAEDEPADDCGSPSTVGTEVGNGVTITSGADVIHFVPLSDLQPSSDNNIAPALNPGQLFLDVTDALMTVSPDTLNLYSAAATSSHNVEPPPAPCPSERECGVVHLVPAPQEPASVAIAPALAPFGMVDPVNGGTALKSVETCEQAEPPLKAKVEHLLEAARHLAGAGYEEESKLFRVEAEAIQNASHRLLTEKRQELERLQREIAELEALTGQYAMIQIDCRIMEFSLPDDCEQDPDLRLMLESGVSVIDGHPCAPDDNGMARLLTGDFLSELLDRMEHHDCGTLKTIAKPRIVTTNGRPATLRTGGEFPIMIPVAAEKDGEPGRAHIDWKNFGLSMQAVPFLLGDGKVRLSLETELADRDFSNATNLNGTVVPGLTTRRFRNDVEVRFGDTVAITCNSIRANGDETQSLLVLVTARQIEPLTAEAAHD